MVILLLNEMKNASVYIATFSNITRCIFFIAIFVPVLAKAQIRGTVEVIKDPRIDTLVAKRGSLMKGRAVTASTTGTTAVVPGNTFRGQIDGYRVQIYSGSVRQEAYDAQAKFKDTHPDMRTYIIYNEPNYKVRAGDFRTRLEAEKAMQELRRAFTSLFIIEEKINPPKTEAGND